MINRLFQPFYRLMQYPVIVSKFHTFRSIYSVIVRYGIGKGKLFGFLLVCPTGTSKATSPYTQ